MASMFPMSAIQMRMKRNCEVNALVAVVVIHAALQCAMVWLVTYLKSSEADTHNVHICGSVVVVVVVMGMIVLGSRMVCSDSKSTAWWCDESVVIVETAPRKKAMCCAL
jgi:heme/copper-type cytochrome/quinol oxidase subunit 4